jgi:serine/threonine-protein kinase
VQRELPITRIVNAALDLVAQTTELAGPPLPHSGGPGDTIPRRIGKFRILDLLAQGMALVYKALQDHPRRVVALKVPCGGRLLGPEVRERFLREIRLTASMDLAGIVPVLEVGEIDGAPFYTMPFIEGYSLADFVQVANPVLARRLEVFQRICVVAQGLHQRGVVHCDLKPANVIVDKHGEVRLLDFGLARSLAESESPHSKEMIVGGTLQYMAPEQTLPGRAERLTPAADVYSLGVILYWLLTDSHPYHASGSHETALAAVRQAVIQPPSQLRPGLGPRFDRVVMGCLAKDHARRPPHAGALAAILAEECAPACSTKH